MRRRVGIALIGATGIAAGCAYDPTLLDATDTVLYEVPAVRVMEPQGPEFNQGLRVGYLDLGQSMGSDFPDKLHFEFKAVDSAKGEHVLPDPVESRWLAADRAEELAAARARLLAALDQTRARQGARAGGDARRSRSIAGSSRRSGARRRTSPASSGSRRRSPRSSGR